MILWLVAPLLLLQSFLAGSSLTGGLLPILLLGLFLTAAGEPVGLLSLYSGLPSGLLLGCLPLIRVGGLSRLKFRGFGRSMMSVFSSCLGMVQCNWMSPVMQVMSLVHGLSGLGLLRLHLLMLSGSVVVLYALGPGSWARERFVPSCSAWWTFGEESTE